MDDDLCVMDEIVPVVNHRNFSELSDVKLSPCHVKVCVLCLFVYSQMIASLHVT